MWTNRKAYQTSITAKTQCQPDRNRNQHPCRRGWNYSMRCHAASNSSANRRKKGGKLEKAHGAVWPNSINQRQDFCRDTSTTTRIILRIRLSRRLLREPAIGYQGVRTTTPRPRHRDICIAIGFNSDNPLTGNRFSNMPVGYHGVLRQRSRDRSCCGGSETYEGRVRGTSPLNVARDTRDVGLEGSPDELSGISGGIWHWK